MPQSQTRELFVKHSLRCTRQRMAVYEAVRSSSAHPTAEDVFQMVRDRIGQLSLATVYNALDALRGAGLIRRLPATDGSSRYDWDTSVHLHLDLGPDGVEDVPDHDAEDLLGALPADAWDSLGKRIGVEIQGVTILIHGTRTPTDESAVVN